MQFCELRTIYSVNCIEIGNIASNRRYLAPEEGEWNHGGD